MKDYSSYELKALQELAGYRNIFYDRLLPTGNKDRKVKPDTISLQKSIDTFIEIFCQNNFADADYTIIQNGPREFETAEDWINQINIDTVLKCLTYIIWTDKSNNGYFMKSIKSKLIDKHLTRLENILIEQHSQLKVKNTPIIFMNTEDTRHQMISGVQS